MTTMNNTFVKATGKYFIAVEIKNNNTTTTFKVSGNNYNEVRNQAMAEINDTNIVETFKINDNGVWTEVKAF